MDLLKYPFGWHPVHVQIAVHCCFFQTQRCIKFLRRATGFFLRKAWPLMILNVGETWRNEKLCHAESLANIKRPLWGGQQQNIYVTASIFQVTQMSRISTFEKCGHWGDKAAIVAVGLQNWVKKHFGGLCSGFWLLAAATARTLVASYTAIALELVLCAVVGGSSYPVFLWKNLHSFVFAINTYINHVPTICTNLCLWNRPTRRLFSGATTRWAEITKQT